MKKFCSFLLLALSVIVFSGTLRAAAGTEKLHVVTDKGTILEITQTTDANGVTTSVISAVLQKVLNPETGKEVEVIVASSLVGAKVEGLPANHADGVVVSNLTITPQPTTATPNPASLTLAQATNVLQSEVTTAVSLAITNGYLPATTVIPVVTSSTAVGSAPVTASIVVQDVNSNPVNPTVVSGSAPL